MDMTDELEFAGHYLIDRGYSYPEDFNADTALDLAAAEATEIVLNSLVNLSDSNV
jgi:hypothetical protein